MARLILLVILSVVFLGQGHADRLSSFRTKTLNAFNDLRKERGLSTMQEDSDLTREAQKWADKLANKAYVVTSNQHVNGQFAWELVGRQMVMDMPVKQLKKMWMEGSTKKTMIKSGFTKFGLGKSVGKYGNYKTFNFVAMFQ